MVSFLEWFDSAKNDRAFLRAQVCSVCSSGFAGLVLADFWHASKTGAAVSLLGGAVAAAWLEGRKRRWDWWRLAGAWFVAGLTVMLTLSLLGSVTSTLSALHLVPVLVVHTAAIYSVRTAQRPVVVGGAIAVLSCLAATLPLRTSPVVVITEKGLVLVDGVTADPDTIAKRFHVGESVTLDASDAPPGSAAREVANRVFVQLKEAGVRIEL